MQILQKPSFIVKIHNFFRQWQFAIKSWLNHSLMTKFVVSDMQGECLSLTAFKYEEISFFKYMEAWLRYVFIYGATKISYAYFHVQLVSIGGSFVLDVIGALKPGLMYVF